MPVRLHIIKRIFSKCTLGFKTLNRYKNKSMWQDVYLISKNAKNIYIVRPLNILCYAYVTFCRSKDFHHTDNPKFGILLVLLCFRTFNHFNHTIYCIFLSNQPIPTFFEPTKLKFRTLNQFLPSRYGAGQNITQNTSS